MKNFGKDFFKEYKKMNRKWQISIILLVLLSVGLIFLNIGCSSPSHIFVETNYKNGELILKDMIVYIEKDKSLSNFDKEIRINAIKEWLKMNRAMNNRYKELK